MIALVGMAVGADLALVGKDLVRVVLGPQWSEAGTIFSFFGPGIGIMLLYSTTGWIHLSIGRPNRWLRWSFLEFAVTALLFIGALRWGPEGIAVAWSASFWILIIPAFWYAGRPIQLEISLLISAVWKYAVASLLSACTCMAFALGFLSLPVATSAAVALERILIISGLFVGLYLGAVIVLHRGFAPIRQLASLLRECGSGRRPAPAAITIRTVALDATEKAPLALGEEQS
jgi:PST family polysaccharide transporter